MILALTPFGRHRVQLNGVKATTPLDDVDVVWFDPTHSESSQDQNLETLLHAAMPNLNWDVKTQARIHIIDSVKPYKSLENAIEHWPETASATAVRRSGGQLKLIAHHWVLRIY